MNIAARLRRLEQITARDRKPAVDWEFHQRVMDMDREQCERFIEICEVIAAGGELSAVETADLAALGFEHDPTT